MTGSSLMRITGVLVFLTFLLSSACAFLASRARRSASFCFSEATRFPSAEPREAGKVVEKVLDHSDDQGYLEGERELSDRLRDLLSSLQARPSYLFFISISKIK